MAVEINYVVTRNGAEKLITKDKKEADKYDKMLDVADNISEFLGTQELDLSEAQLESIGISLSKNKDLIQNLYRGKPLDEVK